MFIELFVLLLFDMVMFVWFVMVCMIISVLLICIGFVWFYCGVWLVSVFVLMSVIVLLLWNCSLELDVCVRKNLFDCVFVGCV